MTMTKTELTKKIKALGKITDEQRCGIVCSLIGHSHVVEFCFGYVTCARCGDQIGDTLGGAFKLDKHAIVGIHTKDKTVCKECLANYKKMTWEDMVFLPGEKFKKLLAGLDLEPCDKWKPPRANNRRKR